MIEKKFIEEKVKEAKILEYLKKTLSKAGYSHAELQRTPLGMRIITFISRPALVIGRRGSNIMELQETLKTKFKLEKPQIEIREVEKPEIDAQIMVDRIASQLERFGSARFKAIGHNMVQKIMNAGAKGVEIRLSGKIPSSRSRSWRFGAGHLPKCGNVSDVSVQYAQKAALLKSGVIGITVSILLDNVKMPDTIIIKKQEEKEVKEEKKEPKEVKEEIKEDIKKELKEEEKNIVKDLKKEKEENNK